MQQNQTHKTTTVRLPVDLHRQIKLATIDGGISFNQFIADAVREKLARTEEQKPHDETQQGQTTQ